MRACTCTDAIISGISTSAIVTSWISTSAISTSAIINGIITIAIITSAIYFCNMLLGANKQILWLSTFIHRTRSQYKGKYLSGRLPENLTLCRIHEISLKKYHVKALEQSFPMMYNTI